MHWCSSARARGWPGSRIRFARRNLLLLVRSSAGFTTTTTTLASWSTVHTRRTGTSYRGRIEWPAIDQRQQQHRSAAQQHQQQITVSQQRNMIPGIGYTSTRYTGILTLLCTVYQYIPVYIYVVRRVRHNKEERPKLT